jgi:hypothetical protein
VNGNGKYERYVEGGKKAEKCGRNELFKEGGGEICPS